jgi:hypothetical protein
VVTIRVSKKVPAERACVWAEMARVEDHIEWMLDATAIRFQGDQRSGIGTIFECDTKVGPIRLTDLMEITEWEPLESIGVRHRGAVSGGGRFVLVDAPGRATIITWEETLNFPWWLGATVGALLAQPVFRSLWNGNLRRLGQRVDEARTENDRSRTANSHWLTRKQA